MIPPASAPLVIDTVGPQVTDAFVDRLRRRLNVTMKDNLSALGPVEIFNSANFFFGRKGAAAAAYPVTGIVVLPVSADPTVMVILTIDDGRPLRGGARTLTILSWAGRDGPPRRRATRSTASSTGHSPRRRRSGREFSWR